MTLRKQILFSACAKRDIEAFADVMTKTIAKQLKVSIEGQSAADAKRRQRTLSSMQAQLAKVQKRLQAPAAKGLGDESCQLLFGAVIGNAKDR